MISAIRPNKTLAAVVTFVLWLGTAVLGLQEIVIVRDLILRLGALFAGGGEALGPEYWAGRSFEGMGTVIVLALVYIAIVLGGAEYHYQHFNQLRSWKLFGWTYAVMLSILILVLFI